MVDIGAAPGAVLGVSWRGRHYFHAHGVLGIGDETRPDSTTVYDMASLTKVIGLTTAVAIGVEEGVIDLDAPVHSYVPAFVGDGKSAVTIRQLLTHSSGMPAWRPLYEYATDRADAMALADTTALDTTPGTNYEYSDLGAIVLTQVVEAVYGERLDQLLARRVFQPLGLGDTRFLPDSTWLARIAPTENDPWRGRIVRGEVHDENASRMGGVSGHAGLFSSARDLLRFGDWLLEAWRDEPGADWIWPAPPTALRKFTRKQDLPEGSSRAVGWDTPSQGSSAGSRLSHRSFGHTGFTGTSIWIDPTRDLVIVLLSNRVHPTRENQKWNPVRRNVANRVVSALEDRHPEPSGSPAR
jgi:CubicO group peptidase (beta-lactamase class C family)